MGGTYSRFDSVAQRHMTMQNAKSKTAAKSIVFADNDVLLLEAIGEILRNSGYEVHLARDGLLGLKDSGPGS